MSEINIKLPEMSKTAERIRNCNSEVNNIIAYVIKNMSELNSIWQSDGQEVLFSHFQKHANRFIDESEVIESYAKFLDDTVASYDSIESLKGNNEIVSELANDLDEFARDYDTYSYNDEVEDRFESIQSLTDDINNHNVDGILEYLQEIVNDARPYQDYDEFAIKARSLINRLLIYKNYESEELFRRLGYSLHRNDGSVLQYEKNSMYYIEFYLDAEEMRAICEYPCGIEPLQLTLGEIQAINHQLIELGWIQND